VTVFSAPDYCGEFDNKGGVMIVDANLKCSFAFLQPLKRLNNESTPMKAFFQDCEKFERMFPFQ
jgi:hypothetical protein